MPQMAPYNWLMLFSMFNMIMIFFISNNHFSPQIKNTPYSPTYFKKMKFKWKW